MLHPPFLLTLLTSSVIILGDFFQVLKNKPAPLYRVNPQKALYTEIVLTVAYHRSHFNTFGPACCPFMIQGHFNDSITEKVHDIGLQQFTLRTSHFSQVFEIPV